MYNRKNLVNTRFAYLNVFIRKKDFCREILCLVHIYITKTTRLTQNLHTTKLDKITVFFAVSQVHNFPFSNLKKVLLFPHSEVHLEFCQYLFFQKAIS